MLRPLLSPRRLLRCCCSRYSSSSSSSSCCCCCRAQLSVESAQEEEGSGAVYGIKCVEMSLRVLKNTSNRLSLCLPAAAVASAALAAAAAAAVMPGGAAPREKPRHQLPRIGRPQRWSASPRWGGPWQQRGPEGPSPLHTAAAALAAATPVAATPVVAVGAAAAAAADAFCRGPHGISVAGCIPPVGAEVGAPRVIIRGRGPHICGHRGCPPTAGSAPVVSAASAAMRGP